jgi:hypothetical protein
MSEPVDELAARRARKPEPFALDCDGLDCIAKGVFLTVREAGAWTIERVGDARGVEPPQVFVFCPACSALRRKSARR